MACAAQQQLSALSTVVWRQEAQLWNCGQRSKFNPGSTRLNFWLSSMITWAHLESRCLCQLLNIVLLSVNIHKHFSAARPLTCTMLFPLSVWLFFTTISQCLFEKRLRAVNERLLKNSWENSTSEHRQRDNSGCSSLAINHWLRFNSTF